MGDIVDHVGLHARLQPGRLALRDLAHGRDFSYAALDEAVARCAGCLRALGIGAGQRVATLARNRAELAMLHLACARLGTIYVPLNWRLAAPEVAWLLEDCEPHLLVGDTDFLAGLPVGCPVMAADELWPRIDASAPLPAAPIDRSQPSLILYTSGTSGRPKGALLTEANLDQTAINFSLLARVTNASIFLSDSPMFHVIGLITTLRPPLMQGATLLLSDAFEPARTLARMADPAMGVTHYFCVPQMAQRLRSCPDYDAAKLRDRIRIFTGGAPHARAAIMAWVDDGVPIVDGFGMSEAGTVFCMPCDCGQIALHAGSAGVPTPAVQARIVDMAGKICSDGTPGELQLRGANITGGYWRRPEATARAFTPDGWFLTGDVAVRDAAGFYTLVDRRKDMFISGGENVYPAEIEAALADFPGLAEYAVVGVNDADWGEVGHCVLVTHGTAPDLAGLHAHLAPRLARYKLPRRLTVLDALPRTASGKVRKDVLRQLLANPV